MRRGQIVTLLGANGAGKTTTLKTISALVRATAGAITLDGEDITEPAPATSPASASSMCPRAATSCAA